MCFPMWLAKCHMIPFQVLYLRGTECHSIGRHVRDCEASPETIGWTANNGGRMVIEWSWYSRQCRNGASDHQKQIGDLNSKTSGFKYTKYTFSFDSFDLWSCRGKFNSSGSHKRWSLHTVDHLISFWGASDLHPAVTLGNRGTCCGKLMPDSTGSWKTHLPTNADHNDYHPLLMLRANWLTHPTTDCT